MYSYLWGFRRPVGKGCRPAVPGSPMEPEPESERPTPCQSKQNGRNVRRNRIRWIWWGLEMTVDGSAESTQECIRAAREEFARQFGALYRAGGSPSLRSLAAASRQRIHVVRGPVVPAPVSAQRISDWKSGRAVPFRFESLVPVLVVLIEGARRRGNIRGAELRLRVWRRVWARARTGRPGPGAGVEPDQQPASSHTPWFAGRQGAVETLLGLLEEAGQAAGEARIVLLTGASGVGKTALLTAGLLPALGSDRIRPWEVRTVVPEVDTPLSAVDSIAAIAGQGSDSPMLSAPEAGALPVRRLVVLDQFDRILDDPGFPAVSGRIHTLLRSVTEHAVVLIVLRSGAALGMSGPGGHHEFDLPPMTTGELRGALREVLHNCGARPDDTLEEVLMVRICGIRCDSDRYGREPAELVILMRTLWAMLRGPAGSGFRIASYRRIGGVEGVVHSTADSVWAGLSAVERTAAKRLVLEFVAVHDDSGVARRRISSAELRRSLAADPVTTRVLERLVDDRIVTDDGIHVYLSHELLLTWQPVAGWTADRLARLQRV